MKKLPELKHEKFEIKNYLLELQPDIAREAFKVRSGMIDVQKNYSNTIATSALCVNQKKKQCVMWLHVM